VLEAAQLLLKLGADVNAVDANGETAMHGAAYKNLPKVMQFLADNGAKNRGLESNEQYGWTPLRIAEGYRPGISNLRRNHCRASSGDARCGRFPSHK